MNCSKFPVSFFSENILTLNVRGPSYLGLTRSISWLLMPWLLTSPGHQQPWYWQCRICSCLTWGRISSTCVIPMLSNDIKCKYMFMFPLKNLARKGLTIYPCIHWPVMRKGLTNICHASQNKRVFNKTPLHPILLATILVKAPTFCGWKPLNNSFMTVLLRQ